MATLISNSASASRAFTVFATSFYRDWGQVLANGGLGAFLVCLHALFPGQSWSWIAFAGALATVTADTWATELGVLSPAPPRLILTGRPVEPGTSGGVTPLGTLAAVGGSTTIGLVSTWLQPSLGGSGLIAVVAFCGLLGSFVDSLLGATVQGLYTCPTCQKETERFPRHSCGTPTAHTRGWRWLNNDWVNFIASLTGALSAVAASYAVGR